MKRMAVLFIVLAMAACLSGGCGGNGGPSDGAAGEQPAGESGAADGGAKDEGASGGVGNGAGQEEKKVVSREKFPNCENGEHGVEVITYSDGSTEKVEY